MLAAKPNPLTVDEFLIWAAERPERVELFDGVPVAMSPERVVHGRTKYQVATAFTAGIRDAGLGCEAVVDSAAVRIDAHNSYQPDLMVYCGERAPGSAVLIDNPGIVVEVLSPGNAMKDLRDEFLGYFRVPSVHHYLIVDPDKRLVIHHARGDDAVATRIVTGGAILLDPPGLSVAVEEMFASI
jgi:Uma2 family endonuclease